MDVKISMTSDGKVKMTTGSERVRLDSLEKYLGRNHDAILVKLEGTYDLSMNYKPGHVCRIKEDDDGHGYNVFVGKHFIGQLPEKAIAFAESVDMDPVFIPAIVGKVEDDSISIYIAE